MEDPSDGMPADVEAGLRCRRLFDGDGHIAPETVRRRQTSFGQESHGASRVVAMPGLLKQATDAQALTANPTPLYLIILLPRLSTHLSPMWSAAAKSP